jgi:hypothetical protein
MAILLGLNPEALSQVDSKEKAAYGIVAKLFIVAIVMSILSSGYFGFLLTHHWFIALCFSVFLGFIHFSVLRISLITLITKPLVEKGHSPRHATNNLSLSTKVNTSPFLDLIKHKIYLVASFLSPAGILRLVFVGLLALTISIPLATLFFHSRAMEMEARHRHVLMENITKADGLNHSTIVSSISLKELSDAHYPFVIIRTLSADSMFKGLVLLFCFLVYAPLLTLTSLRFNQNNKYGELIRQQSRAQIFMDYQKVQADNQAFLDLHFPHFPNRLSDLSVYSDAPFNQEFKKPTQRRFGSSLEFEDFINRV